jgi:hypothetical protein
MSETPLSDLIAHHCEAGTAQSFAQFLDGFRGSMLGVVAVGIPEVVSRIGGKFVSSAKEAVSIGLTDHAGGKSMALAFADPAAFALKFGRPFNAEIAGDALLDTVLLNPKCEGLLVNSALAEVSIVIDRATAESITRPSIDKAPTTRKPWWQFW